MPAFAHDIPADATVHALIRPAGRTLQVIVRVPLSTIRDIQFPETSAGYLDIEKLSPLLPNAVRVQIAGLLEIREGSRVLAGPAVAATHISLESDRSLEDFDTALKSVRQSPPPNSANLIWNQVFLDSLLEYPIESDRSRFFIRERFDRLAARVFTDLRFTDSQGTTYVYPLREDPGLLALDPSWFEVARRFLAMGFWHITEGIDHLLFLFCLVIPLRRLRALIVVVTAFTLAHSITLFASAAGFAPDGLWFPPLIETLIAASIVYMALENIVGTATVRHRWIAAFGFGFVHGFGLSFALRERLQLAGSHLFDSLLAFNIGVEAGQILVLLLLVPILNGLFRYVVAERMGTIILSALVAHTGWHWMMERAEVLKRFL
jgi:hypothetical protein